jgi:hypothetical protein
VSAADREKWDARYRERAASDRAHADVPSALLTSLDELLPRRGAALDVAGGAGRHAVWLARRGLDVTVADVSGVGLDQARAAAASAGVALATELVDLEGAPLPARDGGWDLILVFHYLERRLFALYPGALAPGGLLVVVHPTVRNLERHASPSARFLLAEGELRGLAGPLVVVRYDEGWLDEGRHEARLVARRA